MTQKLLHQSMNNVYYLLPNIMNIIEHNLQRIYKEIKIISQLYSRNYKYINLLAVSKQQELRKIELAILAGQRDFGENYVKEGIEKIKFFSKKFRNIKLIWHFIGRIQSNKIRLISEYFDWCHTVDRTKLAYLLNEYRPIALGPINILIQINISNDQNKSGIYIDQLISLATTINKYQNLRLRGIMSIPAKEKYFQNQLYIHKKMFFLFENLKNLYPQIDTLSIGMSNDMTAAIAAGSTLIRIGTAIFGQRNFSI